MKNVLLIALVAAPALMFSTLEASAWQRNGTTTGSGGRSVSSQTTGNCSGGSCSRTSTYSGPNGGTATRQHGVTCANGVCSSSSTVKGANGGGWTRNSNISR